MSAVWTIIWVDVSPTERSSALNMLKLRGKKGYSQKKKKKKKGYSPYFDSALALGRIGFGEVK